MSAARTIFALTACAIAFGGLVGAAFVAVSGPGEPALHIVDRSPRDPAAAGAVDSSRVSPSPEPVGEGPAQPPEEHSRSLTTRLDDSDAGVRHALALELLRRGPAAYPQARALRPATDEGRELQSRLVLALDKMRLLRRSNDYPKLPAYLRERLDLDAFRSVVPEQLLLAERESYWEQELVAVRNRIEKGHGAAAEESIVLLELALAQREAGTLTDTEYADQAMQRLPEIEAWIAERRGERNASPAAIRELEVQVQRLKP